MEGVSIIHREVVKQDALYYAGDSLHRFVVRISIRVHSKDCKQISKTKALAQQQLEYMQNQALRMKKAGGAKKGGPGKGKSGKGAAPAATSGTAGGGGGGGDSHIPHHNIHSTHHHHHGHDAADVEVPFELQYYGSVLEACCVYKIHQDQDTGEVSMKHTGQHPYSNFVSQNPLDSIPYIRLKPCSLQQGLRSDPTHRRFKLYEDVSINGTEIVIRVRCTHWSSMRKIQDYAKGFLTKIFPAFRIRPSDITTTAQSSCELEEDIFVDAKLPRSVITHVVQHQMDVTVEPLPFAKKSLLKVQVATTDVGGMQSMASVIFGRTTSNANANSPSTGASSSGKGGGGGPPGLLSRGGPGIAGKLSPGKGPPSPRGGLSRSKSISKDSNSPQSSMKQIDPDVGKMFVVWRWRDIDNSDRDVAVPSSVKMEYSKRFSELRAASSRVWLTCKQCVSIVTFFPVLAKDGHCYREDAIVTLFPRITDIENFCTLVETLPVSYHVNVYNRIGWMNAINTMKLSRYVDLDLRIDDNRRLTQCIVTMFTGGGGVHLIEQRFRRTYENDFIPGWEIPAMWDATTYTGNLPKGIPTDGNFIATLALKEEPEKREKYLKVRQKMSENTLMNVPRGDGSDLHLKTGTTGIYKEHIDYDYLKR